MVYVYSPSMGKVIPNQVLRPRGDGSAPVFYLLNGRSGGVEGDSWLDWKCGEIIGLLKHSYNHEDRDD